ncbi:heavy-metal-associated domain-containing protein [Planomonospora sp. ID67723]|uniref:heavy-metal-associated domain-containing protein n=1 Tax=Planomonospora sp. ID67723 TaxID=2738134 RepID=UPI0018C3590C|nr:heavy-metal-associated domain-containing protein [Planomonospora sp. ID67723]MBG0831702.1 heavy-metal-associated domain-containing protein [Planomonospora sp. ID67723]
MCTACSCSTTDTTSAPVGTGAGTVYTVTGMTCGHCVSSVSAQVGRIPGVTGVGVDLPAGEVSVSGAGFSDEQVRAAVERAGYTLAGAAPASA